MTPDPTTTPAAPPRERLWTEDDLAAFLCFRSVAEFINRHPTFPAPVPFSVRGKRWRPSDVVAWVDALCEGIATDETPGAGPWSGPAPGVSLVGPCSSIIGQTVSAALRDARGEPRVPPLP